MGGILWLAQVQPRSNHKKKKISERKISCILQMIIHGCLKRCIFCIRIYLWKADAVKQSYKKILVVGISIEKGTEFSSVPSFIYGGKILNSITSSKEFILHNISITNTACLVNVMVVAYVEIFPMVKCPPDIQTAPEQPYILPSLHSAKTFHMVQWRK